MCTKKGGGGQWKSVLSPTLVFIKRDVRRGEGSGQDAGKGSGVKRKKALEGPVSNRQRVVGLPGIAVPGGERTPLNKRMRGGNSQLVKKKRE